MAKVKSMQTKRKIAEALRALLEERDFSKITISDVSERAGINRKTFYYHFQSTDALLAWMIENETINTIEQVDFSQDPEVLNSELLRNVNFVLDYLEQHQMLFHSVNHSVGRGAVHNFIYKNLYPLVFATIAQIEIGQEPEVGFLEFVSEFYTEAIAGVLQNWIEQPKLRNREKIAEYTLSLFGDITRQLSE